MVQALDNIVFLIDETLVFRQYWVAKEELLWASPDTFLEKHISVLFSEQQGAPNMTEKIQQAFQEQKQDKFLYSFEKGAVSQQWYCVKLHLTDRWNEQGKRLLLLVMEEWQEKAETQKNKHLFQSLVNQNQEAIRYIDLDLTICYVNPATRLLYGYEEGELIGKKVDLLTVDPNIDVMAVTSLIQQEGSWAGEVLQMKKDHTLFEAFLSIQLIRDNEGKPMGYVSQSKDISKRKETATKLKNIIAERETLLKEIHHRVKNNLQVITSLLSLQSSTIEEEHISEIFQQSQYRINAMATIHETLYHSNNFVGIDYRDYLITLAEYLLLSMKGKQHQIHLDIQVPPVMLSLDTAIPLGLLVNEILTNALKYGIVGKEKGTITIQLTPQKEQEYELYIGDNGKGYSKEINFTNTTSLGLKLIQNLARQLNGCIERLYTKKGTYYRLLFMGILYETPMDKEKQPN